MVIIPFFCALQEELLVILHGAPERIYVEVADAVGLLVQVCRE